MGSDSTKAHESFAVAPANTDPTQDDDTFADEPQQPTPEATATLDKLEHTFALIEGLPHHGDPDHLHQHLSWIMATAHSELADADLDDPDRDAAHKKLAATAADALASLPDDHLHELATEHGFTHPTLVSGGALVHWLNPAYVAEASSKAKIQAKAEERYHQLAAGDVDEVHGQTSTRLRSCSTRSKRLPRA